jgi:hypothetical protein
LSKLIKRYNTPKVLLYADPPYLDGGQTHKYSFKMDDFLDLRKLLDRHQGSYLLNLSMHYKQMLDIFGKPDMVTDHYRPTTKGTYDDGSRWECGYWWKFLEVRNLYKLLTLLIPMGFSLEDLNRVVHNLSSDRPIFHSEDDLNFSLALKLKEYFGDRIRLRIEVPFPHDDKNERIDILVLEESRRIGIELKYLKAPINWEDGIDKYELKEQYANNILSYGCLKDIKRIESWIPDKLDEGYTLWITNKPSFYGPKRHQKKPTSYDQFRIFDGRQFGNGAEMKWNEINGKKPATAKGIYENRIFVTGNYIIRWQQYSEIPIAKKNNIFKYCVLKISKPDSKVSASDIL